MVPCACYPPARAPRLWCKRGRSQPSSGGEYPIGGKRLRCQCSPEHWLGHQLRQDFCKCQTHRKASAGASGSATRHEGGGNQPLWVLAFAVLTARSVQSALVFRLMLCGLDFNPWSDFIIVWCPTPISKLYLRVGAVTPHAFIFPFPVLLYIHSIWFQELKEIHLNPRQAVTAIKNIWEIMYPRNCMPSGEKQLPAGGKVKSKIAEISPLRRSDRAQKSKAVRTYLHTMISTGPAALHQRRSWKYKCKPSPHPALPETLPKPALLHSSWLIVILNTPKGSDLLFFRHVSERVLAVGTGGYGV